MGWKDPGKSEDFNAEVAEEERSGRREEIPDSVLRLRRFGGNRR